MRRGSLIRESARFVVRQRRGENGGELRARSAGDKRDLLGSYGRSTTACDTGIAKPRTIGAVRALKEMEGTRKRLEVQTRLTVRDGFVVHRVFIALRQ